MINQLIAGTTLDFLTTLSADYPASAWTLTWSLRGPQSIDIVAIASGNDYRTQQSAAQTALWPAGVYSFVGRVQNVAGVVAEVLRGRTKVLPNIPQQAAGYDGRTTAEIQLEAVQAEITARVTGGATVEYTIGSRSLKKEPLAALLALRTQLMLQIAQSRRAEAIASGLGDPTKKFVRFGSF